MTKVALLFAQGTEECEALNVVDILRRGKYLIFKLNFKILAT